MLTLYAESSAVLAWLLGEPAGGGVRKMLAEADLVLASDLTIIECERALIRALAQGAITEAQSADRRARLGTASAYWALLRLDSEITERARRPFPGEPIRTLDALHLSSALVARAAVPGVAVLSLDHRVRAAAKALGFGVVPRETP